MPLIQGYGKSAIGKNIKAEMGAGKPRKQAIAIGLNVARRAAKAAGNPSKEPPEPLKERMSKQMSVIKKHIK